MTKMTMEWPSFNRKGDPRNVLFPPSGGHSTAVVVGSLVVCQEVELHAGSRRVLCWLCACHGDGIMGLSGRDHAGTH